MNYWLDLFTGITWEEYRKAGGDVSGFRQRMRATVEKIRPGDILLCYLTGVMRWIGALEVIGPSRDTRRIWEHAEFPARLEVRPLVALDPEHGVPMEELEGRTSFFAGPEDRGKFKGFVRRSPNLFQRREDAGLILDLLRQAAQNPVSRPVDPKKLWRRPLLDAERRKGKRTVGAVVSVPGSEVSSDQLEARGAQEAPEATTTTRHTEVQLYLLELGAEMGFELWAPRNDRSKTWDAKTIGLVPGMLSELPTQFNEATNRTIEFIDVLWLRGKSIVAAFEIECTTSIYSGLLRMSDLLALQPNLKIKLYLVAPHERRDKVEQEVLRPTFALRDPPLPKLCGFLPFSTLLEKVDGIRKLDLSGSVKPDFLERTAEFFGDEEAET